MFHLLRNKVVMVSFHVLYFSHSSLFVSLLYTLARKCTFIVILMVSSSSHGFVFFIFYCFYCHPHFEGVSTEPVCSLKLAVLIFNALFRRYALFTDILYRFDTDGMCPVLLCIFITCLTFQKTSAHKF